MCSIPLEIQVPQTLLFLRRCLALSKVFISSCFCQACWRWSLQCCSLETLFLKRRETQIKLQCLRIQVNDIQSKWTNITLLTVSDFKKLLNTAGLCKKKKLSLYFFDLISVVYKLVAWFVFLTSPSGTEALPPAWNECYGVYQSYPHPEDQSGARLCAEGTDQRTGKVPSMARLY